MKKTAKYVLAHSLAALFLISISHPLAAESTLPYTIVDTGQDKCYNNSGEISEPQPGQPFHGQDAQHNGKQPAYKDNGDGTITDKNTGLMWSKTDSGTGLNWEAALAWVQKQNTEKHLGHNDWRLPDPKELQSIVDYTRIPAISELFQITRLPDGEFPFFWTCTTHLDGPIGHQGTAAVYFSSGRALGWMQFPHGRGPQGDVVRINNFIRLVRDSIATPGAPRRISR